jgi:hypothetical protein
VSAHWAAIVRQRWLAGTITADQVAALVTRGYLTQAEADEIVALER